MKTITLLTVFALATGPGLLAADATDSRAGTPPTDAAAACCKKETPACCAVKKPACCADAQPAAAGAVTVTTALNARSLYQLDAAWTNDAGEAFNLAALRGRPVILAMFFATCEYACPLLVSDIKRLRELLPRELHDGAQIVLVTFDVERDTVPALRAYRERLALDPKQWTLLRGDGAPVQDLAMLLGVKYKQDARGQFSHSNILTVLNPEGEIVHQRSGLMGDVSEAAKAVVLAAK